MHDPDGGTGGVWFCLCAVGFGRMATAGRQGQHSSVFVPPGAEGDAYGAAPVLASGCGTVPGGGSVGRLRLIGKGTAAPEPNGAWDRIL